MLSCIFSSATNMKYTYIELIWEALGFAHVPLACFGHLLKMFSDTCPESATSARAGEEMEGVGGVVEVPNFIIVLEIYLNSFEFFP